MFAAIWRECLGIEIETPFPRMTFAEADRRFGTDKPDTRFGLEIEDATEATRGSEFGVFAGAEAVRFLRVPRRLQPLRARDARGASRRSAGRRGSPSSPATRSGEMRSPIAKFLSEEELDALAPEPGETLLFAAGTQAETSRVLGAPAAPARPRARADRRGGVHVPLGDGLPDVRVGRGRTSAGRPCTTRSRARPTSGGTRSHERPGRGARARVRPDRQRQRARRRVVQDPRARRPGARLRPARRSGPTSSARSSASCSTRSRWARRRWAGSRSGSTA